MKSHSTAAKEVFRLLHKVAKLIVVVKRMWHSHVKGCPLSSPSSLAFVDCMALRCLLFNNKVHCREEERKKKRQGLAVERHTPM